MANNNLSSFLPDGRLKWLYLDFNSYFASVEQQENPNLRGKPVAVVPMMTDATCAIAASYEAKAFGIKTGTKIFEAKRMCKDLICVLARHDTYVDYHHKLLKVIEDCIPIEKVCSIDECACRLMGVEQTPEGVTALAHTIKMQIYNKIGAEMTCSIGAAPSKLLAKVAAESQKPDGLTIFHQDTLAQQLSALKLTDLPGINIRMEARLRSRGIGSIRQFLALSPKQARAVWGSVEGERFWYALHGYDVPDRITQKSVVGHSRMLDPAHRTPAIASDMARRLTIKAATRLRRYGLYAGGFALSVRTMDKRYWNNHTAFQHSDKNEDFIAHLKMMWDEMMRATGGVRLKKVAVTLFHLREKNQITLSLFDHAVEQDDIIQRPRQNQNRLNLSAAMDNLNRKFGVDTVRIGNVPHTQAGHVGTKIAFNRIPDQKEFSE